MRPAAARPAGRPRDPDLDRAILAAAEQQLREAGYAGMSLEPVGTLLAEEHRHPELLAAFRHRLVEPRRAALHLRHAR